MKSRGRPPKQFDFEPDFLFNKLATEFDKTELQKLGKQLFEQEETKSRGGWVWPDCIRDSIIRSVKKIVHILLQNLNSNDDFKAIDQPTVEWVYSRTFLKFIEMIKSWALLGEVELSEIIAGDQSGLYSLNCPDYKIHYLT